MKEFLKFHVDFLDVISWNVVLGFFVASSFLFQGDPINSAIGAMAIVFLMVLVSHSIHLILGVIRNHPKVGEYAGYITNGPEALAMTVGLLHGKLIFAVGVPLGSNFVNPILLVIAALLTGRVLHLLSATMKGPYIVIFGTALFAGSFYLTDTEVQRWVWIFLTLVATFVLYRLKGKEDPLIEDETPPLPNIYMVPAILLLFIAGYFLDPAVEFTAVSSRVPEGVIAFFVLSFITSWPEFRTSASLFKMGCSQSATMNIVISNITNLWLAVAGLGIYLLFSR